MCILCVVSRLSRRIITVLRWLVVPVIILWAFSQMLPPSLRFEVTSPRLACVFVLLVSSGWHEFIFPGFFAWRARRSALIRERKRVEAQMAAKRLKEAIRRCRNCLTAFRDQMPGSGKFMCTYCGHVSRRPVLDITGVALGKGGPGNIENYQRISRSNMGTVQGAVKGRKCLGESYPRIFIFIVKVLEFSFFFIRWLSEKIWREKSLSEGRALNSSCKADTQKGKDKCNFYENKGEKAKRKAKEKKQARLEKKMLEEEERKQREEVARLVEERRKLRNEKLEVEKESEREAAPERERKILIEREVGKKRQAKQKVKENVFGKDNLAADVGEMKNKNRNEKDEKGGMKVDLALQNGRRNTRNPRKKAEVVEQSELNVGGVAEENTKAEVTPPCKKTARTRAGKVTHEVDSRSVATKKSAVMVSDGDENMTKTTELSSENRKPQKAGKSPIIIDLVDDSDEEEEGSEEKKSDGSVHNTLVIPAEKVTAAAVHGNEGDKIIPAQRTLRGRQANVSVVGNNAKLSESSKHMVTRRVQKGGKNELVVKTCADEKESTVNPSQSPKHVATRRGRRGGQKDEVVENACSNGKLNLVDVSVEAPSDPVGASLEATANLSQSPKQIVTRRSQKVGQKKGLTVRFGAEEDKVNVVDVSVEATEDPVDASLEATANLSESPKQVVTRRSQKVGQNNGLADAVDVSVEATADPVDASLEATANLSQSHKEPATRRRQKAGQKEEIATSASAVENKVNVVDISAKATSDPVEASLEATTNLSQSPKQIVTRRSRKAGQTEKVAVSASAEEDKVNAVDVSVQATSDPSESSKQVVTRRGRKGGQKDEEDKNGAANPAQSARRVGTCRGKKGGQKELVVNASADVSIEATVNYSGSLKQKVTFRGQKGGQKDESVVGKNEAADVEAIAVNPFQSPKQVVTHRGRKGGQKEELEVNAGAEEDKVNAAHGSIEAAINHAELPKQVVTRRGCKRGQKAEFVVTKMVEEDKNKVADVPGEANLNHSPSPIQVVACKGQKGGQKQLELDPSVERDKTNLVEEDAEDCHEDREQSSFEAVDSDVMEKIAYHKNSQRKVQGPKIETRRTCRKQGLPENEGHKKANIVKVSDEKQRQTNSDTDVKETILPQDRKVRASKPRKICGKQDGAAIENPLQGKPKLKESHQKAMSSCRTSIRRDLKADRVGIYEEVNGGEALVNNEAMEEVGSGERNIQRMVENEPEEMGVVGVPVIIQNVPIQREEYEKKPGKPAVETAVVKDVIHMDESNMQDEEGTDATTSEKLVSVPIDSETNFKESAVEIEETQIHDEKQQIIKPIADTADVKDAIHMDERTNTQDEEEADAAASEKLGADAEQQIMKLVVPTDEYTHESQLGDPKYMDEDSEPELIEGYKPEPIENGDYLKQCESVMEVPSTIIEVEDRLDNSSLAEQTKTEETQQFEILSHVKCSGNDKESPIGIKEERKAKERLEILPAESGLGPLEVHDLEAHLDAADIADLNAENVEVQESEFLIHVEYDINEHTTQENPVDVSHGGHLIEQSFGVLQADSQYIYNHEVQDKGLPGLVDEIIKGNQFKTKSENVYPSSSCTAETDEIIQNKDSVAGESLTDTDVDSQDDSLSECSEPLEEVVEDANGINEEQFSEFDSHQEYEGHRIFPDASYLKEDTEGDTDVDSQDDSLSECSEPLEEELEDANGINEEQFSEFDSHQEYEGHGIFPDASHLKEEDTDVDSQDDSLSECSEPLEEELEDSNGTNEEQFSEFDSHQEYEGHRIFPDAFHLKEEDTEDTDDEDESHDLDIAEETANGEKNQDSIADTDDEDDSHDLDIAEETADGEKNQDSIADTDDEDESHDLDIAEETANAEKNQDSISGYWNEGDQSELLREKQSLEIIPHQASDSEARDGEDCTIQYISAICVQQNPISLVNDGAHEYGLNDSGTVEGYHDSVVKREHKINAVCLKVEDHQLVHASYDEAQEANKNIHVSDVGQQHHNSAIKDESHADNDEQFYGLDESYGSKVDTVCSMPELMPSLSQHTGESADYKVDVIHVQTKSESDTSKDQLSCVFNYRKTEADMAEEIVASSISFEDSNDVFTSLGMDESVLEREADIADEIVHNSINFADSNDVYPSSGITDFVLEAEADMASINFEDSDDVFPHSGMDDSVPEKLPEILTTEACKQELSQLDTPLKSPEVTEGYNISPCLTTLFGLDYSTASKRPEHRHCDVEEKIPVSNIDLQINSPLLADAKEACNQELSQLGTPLKGPEVTEGYNLSPYLTTLFGLDYSTTSKRPELRHCDVEEDIPVSNIDLQINSPLLADAKEACNQELSQLGTPLKSPEVAEGYNISPCLTTLFGLEYSTSSKRPELRHCDVEERVPVSNIDLQINSPLLADADNEDESHDLDIAKETADEGMQKGNLLVKDQSVDSGSSLQNDNVLFKDEVNDQESNEFAEYEDCATMKNIFVSNGLLQNDSFLLDKSCQAQSIDFSSNQGFQNLKLNLDASNWNEGNQFEILPQNQVLEIPVQQMSYSEVQDGEECRKDSISLVIDVGLESKTIEGYQGSVVEKGEQIEQFSETQDAQETVSPKNDNDDEACASYDESQEAMKDEAHEDKIYYSDNSEELNGSTSTPQKEEDDSQHIYKIEAHEGESMDYGSTPELKSKLKFDADNLNSAHKIELLPKNLSHLANGEAQEGNLRVSKTSEGFHDSVYEKEEHYECVSMAETQDTEEIISPKIYNGKQNDRSPELLDAVENEAHQDNFFSDNKEEFYGVNELYASTPQKEEDGVERISKNKIGDEIPLTEGNQVEYGSYSLPVGKNEAEDRAYHVKSFQESVSIVDGITDASPIKEQLFDMDNNEHEGLIALPDKVEGKGDDQEEKSIQNEVEEPQKCEVGENIQLVKVDTVASNQEPSGLDTPLKIPKLTEGLDISPCLNSLFGVDESVPEKSPEILTNEACKQELYQLDTPLRIPDVTEGYNISPCLSTLFGLDSSTSSKRPELRNSYNVSPCLGMNDSLLQQNKHVCQTDLVCNHQLSLDTPLKRLEHAQGHDISPCLYTLFGPEYHTPVKTPELTENNVMFPCLPIMVREENRDEDAPQQTLVTQHLLPEGPPGDHVSLMEKDAKVFERTEQSKCILTEKPVESREVAEGATVLATKGDSKSTKLIDRILTLSNRLQTLHLDLQGQLPESFYATPSRNQLNSKCIGSGKKTGDPMSVYRPRQSIESDEAMHSFMKENPTELAEQNLYKENETEAKDSEKVMSKQPALQNFSSNALEQKVEPLDTPLKTLEPTEGRDKSPCLYKLFGPENNTPLAKPELTENNDMSPCLQILFGEQYRDVTYTPFEEALQHPLVTEPGSPELSVGCHVSLTDKDVRVFEEAEQSKLLQRPELCFVTPSREQMNLKGIVSEKKTREPMSVGRPRQFIESEKALHSSMKENSTDLAQLSLRKLRNLYKENETKAKDSEKVMSKRPALQNLSSNALEKRVESLEHTEGHDITPCLHTLFGPEYNNEDKDVSVFEGTEQFKCMQLDLQGQLPELCYVTPSRKQMNSKGIGSAKKTRDPMSVNRPRPSTESDMAMHSSMKENPTDLSQLSLRQLRNLYKEKEIKAKDSEKVVSKRPALQNLSSNALEQRVESVGYSPRPFLSERRLQILEEDCS